jgi:hypothetical protein
LAASAAPSKSSTCAAASRTPDTTVHPVMTRERGFHLPRLIPALQYLASFAIVACAGFAALRSGGWSDPAPSTQVTRPVARAVNLRPERSSPEMVFYLVSSEAEADFAAVLEGQAESANSPAHRARHNGPPLSIASSHLNRRPPRSRRSATRRATPVVSSHASWTCAAWRPSTHPARGGESNQ